MNKNIWFKTLMLRSDLCNYSDTYIVVKRRISVKGNNGVNKRNKRLNFQNNALFRSCTSKINNTFIDNAEDLDIVMLIYNLLEYSNNYSMILGSFWNYYRDGVNGFANENKNANNFRIINNKTTTSKFFEHKTKLIGSTSNNDSRLEAEVVVPFLEISQFAFN